MRLSRRSAVLLSATLLLSTAVGFEPAVHRNLSAGDGSLRLTVGAVRVPLWSVAFAQSARDVSLDDVTVTVGPVSYAMKRIDFTGVTSSEAEIRALFDDRSSEPLGARLERIGAERVTIPEIVAEERLANIHQRTVYRNVVAKDIERGRIRVAEAAESTVETSGPAGKSTFVQERLAATETDLAALVRIYTQKAGSEPEPMTRIQGSYTVESTVMTADEGIAKIGRITARDLFMRPTQESWSTIASLLLEASETVHPPEKEMMRLFTGVLDAADSMQIGFLEMAGIELTSQTSQDTFSAKVRRIAYTGATPSQPAEARLEGLAFDVPDGRFKVDLVSYSGFSIEPMVQGARALRDKRIEKFEDFDAATVRSLIPTFGTFRYAGVDFDFEVARKEGGGVDRVKATLKDAELTADKPLNGIPTNLRVAIRNFAVPVPTDVKTGAPDESLKPLLDLGYKVLDISSAVAANWNEAGQEILVRDMAVSAVDMGQISFKAVVGGVSRDVFNPDTAVAAAAALGASARSAELVIENRGLFDRFLAQEARKQKKTPEAIRREYGAAAALTVPAMLGNSEQAKTVGQALARFIARPTRLRITARAKDPAGLGISDLAASSDPLALIEKLEVTATVDERL